MVLTWHSDRSACSSSRTDTDPSRQAQSADTLLPSSMPEAMSDDDGDEEAVPSGYPEISLNLDDGDDNASKSSRDDDDDDHDADEEEDEDEDESEDRGEQEVAEDESQPERILRVNNSQQADAAITYHDDQATLQSAEDSDADEDTGNISGSKIGLDYAEPGEITSQRKQATTRPAAVPEMQARSSLTTSKVGAQPVKQKSTTHAATGIPSPSVRPPLQIPVPVRPSRPNPYADIKIDALSTANRLMTATTIADPSFMALTWARAANHRSLRQTRQEVEVAIFEYVAAGRFCTSMGREAQCATGTGFRPLAYMIAAACVWEGIGLRSHQARMMFPNRVDASPVAKLLESVEKRMIMWFGPKQGWVRPRDEEAAGDEDQRSRQEQEEVQRGKSSLKKEQDRSEDVYGIGNQVEGDAARAGEDVDMGPDREAHEAKGTQEPQSRISENEDSHDEVANDSEPDLDEEFNSTFDAAMEAHLIQSTQQHYGPGSQDSPTSVSATPEPAAGTQGLKNLEGTEPQPNLPSIEPNSTCRQDLKLKNSQAPSSSPHRHPSIPRASTLSSTSHKDGRAQSLADRQPKIEPKDEPDENIPPKHEPESTCKPEPEHEAAKAQESPLPSSHSRAARIKAEPTITPAGTPFPTPKPQQPGGYGPGSATTPASGPPPASSPNRKLLELFSKCRAALERRDSLVESQRMATRLLQERTAEIRRSEEEIEQLFHQAFVLGKSERKRAKRKKERALAVEGGGGQPATDGPDGVDGADEGEPAAKRRKVMDG